MKNVHALVLGLEAMRCVPPHENDDEMLTVADTLRWVAAFAFAQMAVVLDVETGDTRQIPRGELPAPWMRTSK